jgi:phage-related holin
MREWLIKIAIAGISVLAPIKAILITVGILIFADLVTGIMAASKRKEDIDSASLRRTVSKIVVYQIAIITGFLIETYLLENAVPVSKLVATVVSMVEFKSILENSEDILGYSILKVILKQLGSNNDTKTQIIEIVKEIDLDKTEGKEPSDNK